MVKYQIAFSFFIRFIAPTFLGAVVGYLASHGHNQWVPVVCDIANNIGIVSTECKK